MIYPTSITELINSFKSLPGVGEKSAERFAYHVIDMDKEVVENFSKALVNVKTKIKYCPKCNFITENEICEICADQTRDNKTLCVVEDIKSVMMFEKLNVYNGKYFVLDKLISPFDKIGPDETNINELMDTIKNNDIKEVILAIKPTIEGEATSMYIEKLINTLSKSIDKENGVEDKNITISKIAHGIPLGVEMEYLDSLTIELAFKDRKKIS